MKTIEEKITKEINVTPQQAWEVIGNRKAIVDWSASFKATPENGTIAKEAFRNLWNMGLEEMETFINNKN